MDRNDVEVGLNDFPGEYIRYSAGHQAFRIRTGYAILSRGSSVLLIRLLERTKGIHLVKSPQIKISAPHLRCLREDRPHQNPAAVHERHGHVGGSPPERSNEPRYPRSERIGKGSFVCTRGVESGGCRLFRRTSLSGTKSRPLTPREVSRNAASCFQLSLHLFRWFCIRANGPAPHAEPNPGSCMAYTRRGERGETMYIALHKYKRKLNMSPSDKGDLRERALRRQRKSG